MRQQHVVDVSLLGPVVRRVFPGARSVSVEPASAGRLSLWLGPGRNDSPASGRARVPVIQLRNLLAGRAPTASG